MREIYTSWLDDEDGDDEDKGRQPDMPMTAGPVQNALFKSRTVLVFGEIDMRLAERVTAQITAFSAENDKPIRIIINSPGGHVESGDTIHDMIRFCGVDVKVIGTGWVASAGAHIRFLGATAEGKTASACSTPASCRCTSRPAACGGQAFWTSRSRPNRSSRCATA